MAVKRVCLQALVRHSIIFMLIIINCCCLYFSSIQACLTLEPYNEVCQYMKGLSHAAMGQYYDAIKSNTKLMVSHIGPANSNEFDRVKYVRGKCSV